MKFKIIASYLFIFQAFCGSLLYGSMASTMSNYNSASAGTMGDAKASTDATLSHGATVTLADTEHKVSAIESKDDTEDQSIVIVLYGTSGAGKSRLSHALKAKIEALCIKDAHSPLNKNKRPWRILAVDEISEALDQQDNATVEEELSKEKDAEELDRCLADEHKRENNALLKLLEQQDAQNTGFLFKSLDTSQESDEDDDDDKEVANASEQSDESEEDNDDTKEANVEEDSSGSDKEVANTSSSEEEKSESDDEEDEEIEENEALIGEILKAMPTHNLICDTVFEDGKSAKAFMAKLAHVKNLYRVLVYCNIGVLAERTASRNSLAQSPNASLDELSNGGRSSASLMRQYTMLYTPIPLRGTPVNSPTRFDASPTSHASSSSALNSGSRSSSLSHSNSDLNIAHNATPSPRLTSNPTSLPRLTDTPVLDVISEDDFKKAFAPAVKEVTEKVGSEAKISKQMQHQMSQQLISGLAGNFSSAFTPTQQQILVSPTPSINEITDLRVRNNTAEEGHQAVEQIIQFVISRQTQNSQ